jgi:nitroreductase
MTLSTSKSVSVTDALNTRITVRDFLDTPVPQDVLEGLFETARRTPSGGNLQPWRVHVMTGDALDAFRGECLSKLMQGHMEEQTYPAYPSPLWEPQRSWRYKLGEEMYGMLGIAKDDKPGRMKWLANNVRFFGAPVGIIITGNVKLDMPQHLDVGIYLQTLMLLAREAGLHTAPQGWWRSWPDTARKHLDYPEDETVLVGMSLGYGNPDAPVNDLYADRAELGELVNFYK